MSQFSREFADLEIRILARQADGYPAEMTLDQEQSAGRAWLDPSVVPFVASPDPIEQGTRLSKWLFSDQNLRDFWAQARAGSPNCRVRLRIDDGAAELHEVPWELLLDPSGPDRSFAIAASEQTPFSRYLPVKAARARPVSKAPLRVLLVIASPAGLEEFGLQPLDVNAEGALVEEALTGFPTGTYYLDLLPAPVSLQAFLAKLREGYHIVHIVAHSRYSTKDKSAALFLANDDGTKVHIVRDHEFSPLFAGLSEPPRLVLFAGCETAGRDPADANTGFAARLVATGVPAVVAMHDKISIDSARRFAQTFYRELARHGMVDLACNQARADLRAGGRPDAAAPVLFMRLRDGRLLSEDFGPAPLPEVLPVQSGPVQKGERASSSDVTSETENGGAGPYRAPAPGYISDAPDQRPIDRLGITNEVETIAHVLMSKRVKPPMSLGLFGDWGSGKSYFMAELQRKIRGIAAYYRSEEWDNYISLKPEDREPCEWCTRVVQIEFNAWHFSDANLWANLVTRIYEGLNAELNEKRATDRELRQKLQDRMGQAKGAVAEAQALVEQAHNRVNVAREAYQKTQEARRQKQNTLSGLIDDVQMLLTKRKEDKNDNLSKKVDEAAQALGYPEAAKSYAELQELNANLASFSGRLAALSVNLVHAPWSLLVLAALIIGLPLAIGWAMEQFADQIAVVGQRVVEISTLLFGLFAWLKIQVGHGLKLVGLIETGFREAQRVREEAINLEPAVQAAAQALADAQIAEEVAANTLKDAQGELQRLQAELQELRPERRLFRLIEERGRTATYSQHLGIISLIRTDFEQMSKLLVEMIDEERDLATEPPPIQRIMLYIDDLDRCRPERVVEVLEAVHLLLAFPLFIVVVGVDPRWLRHSLAQHHVTTLREADAPAGLAGRAASAFYSTPQEYLEKIFQIPFALRPVEQVGYQKLVRDLLEPLPALQRKPLPAVAPTSQSEDQPPPAEQPASPPTDKAAVTPTAPMEAPVESFRQLSARQLEFREWEQQDIYSLWPLFHTPRSVKRFINIYRLLRAGLEPEFVGLFEGTKEAPGEYQVALLLLGTVTAFPNEATAFLCRLDSWLQELPPGEADKTCTWHEVLTVVSSRPAPHPNTVREAKSKAGAQADRADVAGTGNHRESPEAVLEDAGWEEMIAGLQQVLSAGLSQPFRPSTLRAWALHTARYSFSIYPATLSS